MKEILLATALLLQPIVSHAQPIELLSRSWQIRYSQGVPNTLTAAPGEKFVVIPGNAPASCPAPFMAFVNGTATSNCHALHYVEAAYTASLAKRAGITMTMTITGSNPQWPCYVEDGDVPPGGPSPGCTGQPNCRIHFERRPLDDRRVKSNFHWWSDLTPIMIVPGGPYTMTASFTDLANWSDVDGIHADAIPSDFHAALASPGRVGFTCSVNPSTFGHGIGTIGGDATLHLLSYTIN